MFDIFKVEMGDIFCDPLKGIYHTEENKCKDVILKATEVLDKIVIGELGKLPKEQAKM